MSGKGPITRVKEPCIGCGHLWVRPVVDLSDMDAEELPVYMVCAKCGRKTGT